MPNYQNSKIYKLYAILPDGSIISYYGATTKDLRVRLAGHVQSFKKGECITSGQIIAAGNYNIMLMENYPCSSREELSAREQHYILYYECVNKVVPLRTNKEWRFDNMEKVKEGKKRYYNKNIDKIKKRDKIYYEQNVDIIKETCKRYREQNIDKIKEIGKRYREQNVDKIKEKDKRYREQNFDKIKERHKKYRDQHALNLKEYFKNYRLKKKEALITQPIPTIKSSEEDPINI
jgi:hypothetical protein